MQYEESSGNPSGESYYYKKVSGSDRPKGSTSVAEHDYRKDLINMRSTRIRFPVGHQFHQYYEDNIVFVNGNGVPPASNLPNLTTKNIAKLADNVRGSELQLGADLGERHQTLGMVAQNLERIYQCGVYIKQFRLSEALSVLGVKPDWRLLNQKYNLNDEMRKGTQRKTLISAFKNVDPTKAFADLWLEVAFGIEPLASEIQEAVNQIVVVERNRALSSRDTICIRAASKSQKTLVTDNGVHRSTIDLVEEIRTRSYFGKDYEPPEGNFLGLNDPASVLWEVTPWSFVWDYFWPIGTYLKAKNFQNNVKPLYSWRTEYTKITEQRVYLPALGSPSRSYISESIRRYKIPTDERWTNDAYLPRIKPFSESLTSAHIHNILALARQLI